jgi:hypothetical protein
MAREVKFRDAMLLHLKIFRDLDMAESEKIFWGRSDDESCVEENKVCRVGFLEFSYLGELKLFLGRKRY